MMKKVSRNIIVIVISLIIILIAGLIAYRIIAKSIQARAANRQTTYTVGQVVLKKQSIERTLTYRGIVEGDPQVQVYPTVGGNFISNEVAEGDIVHQNDVITTIDRAEVGQTFRPALVRSPIAGMVIQLYFVDRGEPITPNNPVAMVANTVNIKVVLTVGEADLSQVKKGMQATITSLYDPNLKLPADVDSVTPFVSTATFSGTVIIKTQNQNNALKIGMSIIVDIITSRGDAFLVPQSAIQTDARSAFVFINVGNTARRVTVTQGFVRNNLVEITGDLKEGELVITEGSYKLYDGAKITVAGSEADNKKR